MYKKVPQSYKTIILSMAENNMNITRVAEELHYHRNTIWYHLKQIRRNTGLDPQHFYDLYRLVELVKGDNFLPLGKWNADWDSGGLVLSCSLCNEHYWMENEGDETPNYCPNCGAKMEDVE